MANYNWNSDNDYDHGLVAQEVSELYKEVVYQIADSKPSSISFNAGTEAMISISEQGFWVRGVKVPQDDQEAQTVYNAFKQWLAWANLQR